MSRDPKKEARHSAREARDRPLLARDLKRAARDRPFLRRDEKRLRFHENSVPSHRSTIGSH
jgi:hypothetical protein